MLVRSSLSYTYYTTIAMSYSYAFPFTGYCSNSLVWKAKKKPRLHHSSASHRLSTHACALHRSSYFRSHLFMVIFGCLTQQQWWTHCHWRCPWVFWRGSHCWRLFCCAFCRYAFTGVLHRPNKKGAKFGCESSWSNWICIPVPCDFHQPRTVPNANQQLQFTDSNGSSWKSDTSSPIELILYLLFWFWMLCETTIVIVQIFFIEDNSMRLNFIQKWTYHIRYVQQSTVNTFQ